MQTRQHPPEKLRPSDGDVAIGVRRCGDGGPIVQDWAEACAARGALSNDPKCDARDVAENLWSGAGVPGGSPVAETARR